MHVHKLHDVCLWAFLSLYILGMGMLFFEKPMLFIFSFFFNHHTWWVPAGYPPGIILKKKTVVGGGYLTGSHRVS
jgi:hypothetical protein